MPRLTFDEVPGPWHTNDFKSSPLASVRWEGQSRVQAFIFFGHANIDFDGSPTAYGPRKPRSKTAAIQPVDPPPDDCLDNGGNPKQGYFGIAAMAPTDPLVRNGTVIIDQDAPKFLGTFPIVQQARNGDPKPGYYVSKCSHRHGPFHLQNSYIDSSAVPYGALDGDLLHLGVQFGDLGLAIRHGSDRQSAFYFVDGGGSKFALGECSHKVAMNLGATPVPGRDCTWNNNFPVSFMVFPRSGWMHFDAAKGQEIGFGIQSTTEAAIEKPIRRLLTDLSRADNARDLALLMAFNEGPPPNALNGKKRLEAYLKKRGAAPVNFVNILAGLMEFGLRPFGDDTKGPRDPFNPRALPPSVETF